VPPAAPEVLAKARREAINLTQWLARIANSYVPAEKQEERLTLQFCASRTAFVTGTFGDQLALEMRLPSLQMQFLENGRPVPHIFDPEEHSPANVEAWLLVELLHRGIDRSKFSKELPYHVPDLLSGDAEDYSPRSCVEGLSLLAGWFRNAASILESAAGGTAEVVCWPQYLSLTCRAASKATDFGFSPGDAEHPEPYLYITPRLPGPRSIFPASALLAERDPIAAAKYLFTPR
jgi:hypothetical protein